MKPVKDCCVCHDKPALINGSWCHDCNEILLTSLDKPKPKSKYPEFVKMRPELSQRIVWTYQYLSTGDWRIMFKNGFVARFHEVENIWQIKPVGHDEAVYMAIGLDAVAKTALHLADDKIVF